MAALQMEYVGFTTHEEHREYTLRVRPPGGESRQVIVAIPSEAFLAHRVRYQDGPEICYLKLQRELAGDPAALLPDRLEVTNTDLEAYRVAHAPKPRRRASEPPTA
jgi:hypothetical protein